MGLLKGIHPLLSAEVLYALRKAGHGDRILICDCNFPAHKIAQTAVLKDVIHLPGSDLTTTLDAVLSVLPLDYFIDAPLEIMVPDAGIATPEMTAKFHENLKNKFDAGRVLECERTPFYDSSMNCFVVIQTSERIPYANVIITKGVVGPDGNDLKPE